METYLCMKDSRSAVLFVRYYSPKVEKVEVVRRGRVRRSKLYYLRDRVGKAAKVKEKI